MVPNRPAQTESGIQSFKKSFQLPDNSTTNSYSLIPNKEEWSCRRRAIPNKQFNKTLHHSRTSTEQLERSTMVQHLLQAFLPKQHLMAVWLSRAIIVLYHRFCHIKDVRRKIVIWIIYNNVATETKRLQENMFALENLAYSENLAPPCSSENSSPPLIVKAPLSFWNLAPIAFFRALPPPFTRGEWGGVHSMGKMEWIHWECCLYNRMFVRKALKVNVSTLCSISEWTQENQVLILSLFSLSPLFFVFSGLCW